MQPIHSSICLSTHLFTGHQHVNHYHSYQLKWKTILFICIFVHPTIHPFFHSSIHSSIQPPILPSAHHYYLLIYPELCRRPTYQTCPWKCSTWFLSGSCQATSMSDHWRCSPWYGLVMMMMMMVTVMVMMISVMDDFDSHVFNHINDRFARASTFWLEVRICGRLSAWGTLLLVMNN